MRGNCSPLWGRWYIQVCVKVTGRVKWEACVAAGALPNFLAKGFQKSEYGLSLVQLTLAKAAAKKRGCACDGGGGYSLSEITQSE